MIGSDRYQVVRSRIIELFNILNNRSYGVWITPESMMTLDQVRERVNYTSDELIGDRDYYSTHQLRKMRITQIVDYLPTLRSFMDLGFQDPNKAIVEIYESTQEYISLWCEVMREAPGLRSPPMDELRTLEGLAMFVFPHYKKIKPYRKSLEARRFREDGELEDQGLLGFAALFSFYSIGTTKGTDELSFISHLDSYESRYNTISHAMGGISPSWSMPATAPALGDPNYDTAWVFKG